MRTVTLFCCAALLTGCDKSQNRAAEEGTTRDTAVAPAPPSPSARISLADVAGKWKVRATDEAKGTVVESELTATADTSGWTVTFPNRKPIPVRVVAVAGDSIVTEAGPYESVTRKGIQVRTRAVRRLQDGKLVGTSISRFVTRGPDSVARYRHEGTRAP